MTQIAEVIKYAGNNSTFIWNHLLEVFNSLTQLIVHGGQEAIFFMNGQAVDLFGPRHYTLETESINPDYNITMGPEMLDTDGNTWNCCYHKVKDCNKVYVI